MRRPASLRRAAVTRRVHDELGLVPDRMAVALPHFAYRAETDNRIVDHQRCPASVEPTDSSVALRLSPESAGRIGAGAHEIRFIVERRASSLDEVHQAREKSTFVVPRR